MVHQIMEIRFFLAISLICFAVVGCGRSSRAGSISTPTPIKVGTSHVVAGVKVMLVKYTVGNVLWAHVPYAKPGHQFLESEWTYRNGINRLVALEKTAAVADGRTYRALAFGRVSNIGILRPGEEGHNMWWFEIPVATREVRVVYGSAGAGRGIWTLRFS